MIADATQWLVEEYVQGVLSGEIVSCKLIRSAVERYVRDMDRQSTPEFPYHFDADKARSVVQFFPLILRHTIGPFADLPFELEPFEVFAVWNIFGWKRDSDNSRRFRKVFFSVARKNGKSTLCAGIAHYMAMGDIDPATGRPEAGGQILLSATKIEQADIVYAECERQRLKSVNIRKLSNAKNKHINYAHNGSYIRRLGSDKPFDGMNPSCVIMDELHAWRHFHRKFFDTMVTASGSRTQPLQIIITTAGDDQAELWIEQYTYAASIATGDVQDETLFTFIHELDPDDDPLDEANWPKANPNLGVSVNVDFLRGVAREGATSRAALNRFIRYHGNRITSSNEAAIPMDQWREAVGELSDWSQADAICAGFDLGGRDDLAASAFVARFPVAIDENGKQVRRYEVKAKVYLADDAQRDVNAEPWASWCHAGYVRLCRWPIATLRDELFEDCRELNIWHVGFDPYSAQQLSDEVEKEGLKPVKFAQNYPTFSEPIHEFLLALSEGRLRHDGRNPVITWCAKNAIISRDSTDRWMFNKRDAADKIDPIVAIVMAFGVVMRAPSRVSGSIFVT